MLRQHGGPRVGIIYASTDGQTAKMAVRMARHAIELGWQADVREVQEVSGLSGWQRVIVAAPIRRGRFDERVLRFVRDHRDALQQRWALFLCVCLDVASSTTEARDRLKSYRDTLIRETSWSPARFEYVAGALKYRSYNLMMRWIMRNIARKTGLSTDTSRNHEYTDWAALGRLVEETLKPVQPVAAPQAVAR